jgi:hypothetical protein
VAQSATEARLRSYLEQAFGVPRAAALTAAEVTLHARQLLAVLDAPVVVVEKRLSERTVRYYQSQGIVTPPEGSTSAARYGVRQVLEAAAARLAGHVRHLSIEAAARAVSRRSEPELIRYLAELASGAGTAVQAGRVATPAEAPAPALDEPRPLPGSAAHLPHAAPVRPWNDAAERSGAAHVRVVSLGWGSFLGLTAADPAFGAAAAAAVAARVRDALDDCA